MNWKKATSGAAGFACLALVLAIAQEPPPAAGDSNVVPTPQKPGPYRIGGGVSQPVPIYRPDPDYSEEARKARVQGTVILAIVVDEEGNPRNVRVVKPLGMGLDEKAIETVEKWRFRPGMKDGHPVKVMAQIGVNFRLLVKGWNMGRIKFQLPAGASAAVIHSTRFENPKPRAPGTVWLAFDVDEKGRPNNVSIVRSDNPVLEKAATASVRKWQFDPAMKEGQPIPASGTVSLTYCPACQ